MNMCFGYYDVLYMYLLVYKTGNLFEFSVTGFQVSGLEDGTLGFFKAPLRCPHFRAVLIEWLHCTVYCSFHFHECHTWHMVGLEELVEAMEKTQRALVPQDGVTVLLPG